MQQGIASLLSVSSVSPSGVWTDKILVVTCVFVCRVRFNYIKRTEGQCSDAAIL